MSPDGRSTATAVALIIVVCAAATGQVLAESPEAEDSRALAERLCAQCHMNPGQGEKRGPDGLPSFGAIANRPGQEHEAIVKWLRSRPPIMPDHHLTWNEADALAAYIMSLRTAR